MLTRCHHRNISQARFQGESLERREALTANVVAIADVPLLEYPHDSMQVVPQFQMAANTHLDTSSNPSNSNTMRVTPANPLSAATQLDVISHPSNSNTVRVAPQTSVVKYEEAVDTAMAHDTCFASPYYLANSAVPSSNTH